MKPGSFKPLFWLVLILDIVLVCLALVLYCEFGVGQIPCDTDLDCLTKNGVDYAD